MRKKLDFFFRPLSSLPGIGDRTEEAFARLLPHTRFIDLLFHLPAGIVERTLAPAASAAIGATATLRLEVLGHCPPPPRSHKPYRVECSDGTGSISLQFFKFPAFLKGLLAVGSKIAASGGIEHFGGGLVMTHPDYIVPVGKIADIPNLEPVYPLVKGLTNRTVRKAISQILAMLPEIPEWQDGAQIGFAEALRKIHEPVKNPAPCLERLARDEILANQLSLAVARRRFKAVSGASSTGSGELVQRALGAFGYKLTGAQERVLKEIFADMAAPARMLRLLQGDVGSGKTAIATLALLRAIEASGQGAFMAPTEILAAQHFKYISGLVEKADLKDMVRPILLTGRDKGAERAAKLAGIKSGSANLAIGTHALFQEGVEFSALALAIIDEQHKFGVGQRLKLASKGGEKTDILAMTATPIPRTLALAGFGDMDMSLIDELPPGRREIETRVMPMDQILELAAGLRSKLDSGAAQKAYWICPLIEESENADLSAAIARFEDLKRIFGPRVALAHGKMKPEEKDAAMRDFADPDGAARILVATTVVEVGVHVPEATLMVVEHAERFGLSSLHQLRGRIGRGAEKSSCVLLHSAPLAEAARARLAIMRETADGFRIAEKDLRLRGSGEILGFRQSGLKNFRIADPGIHGGLFEPAHRDALAVMESDPGLETPRGRSLRFLLALFEHSARAASMSAG